MLFSTGQLPYFRFESLPDNGRFGHAVLTRQGGASQPPFATLNLSRSVPDDRATVFANRRRAYSLLSRTQDTLVHAHLVHGAAVVHVGPGQYGQYVGPADGLITDHPDCGLTMNFADCAPILLIDPQKKAIGLGHAGWQGAVKDLPGALVRAMAETFGSDPGHLLAALGPSIGPCCYEVGEPVITAVTGTFPDPESLLIDRPGKARPHFDLPEANRRRLAASGVRQIEPSEICTACRTDLFFSHRAEKGRTGRFGVLLTLNDG